MFLVTPCRVTTFVGFTTFTDNVTFTTANVKNIFFDKSDDSLKFGDNVKAEKFENVVKHEIYHNGNHSYISDTGTGNLRLIGNGNVDIINLNIKEDLLLTEALNYIMIM